MGKGKLAKFAYIDTLPFVLQYPRQRLLEEGFPYAGKWRSHFFDNSYPITLELGCGGGEYTVSLAKEFPHGNYIGYCNTKGSVSMGSTIGLVLILIMFAVISILNRRGEANGK